MTTAKVPLIRSQITVIDARLGIRVTAFGGESEVHFGVHFCYGVRVRENKSAEEEHEPSQRNQPGCFAV